MRVTSSCPTNYLCCALLKFCKIVVRKPTSKHVETCHISILGRIFTKITMKFLIIWSSSTCFNTWMLWSLSKHQMKKLSASLTTWLHNTPILWENSRKRYYLLWTWWFNTVIISVSDGQLSIKKKYYVISFIVIFCIFTKVSPFNSVEHFLLNIVTFRVKHLWMICLEFFLLFFFHFSYHCVCIRFKKHDITMMMKLSKKLLTNMTSP